ncbi:hypothetical protein [Leifsonia sp. AG29]|uniref:hypothetical protein n=1 Tax=Leifsonia sp. AG29 TaxID=2598860 RepID=UPI00131AF823|nr:hypothetical protein [Leifsonia sp. AG29]
MTALPPPVADLEARLGLASGTLDGDDLARAWAALNDAAVLAVAEAGVVAGERWHVDAPAVVTLVVLKAARREYENPRGVQQETQGDHSIGLTETSGVYLTPRELMQLQRAAFGGSGRFLGSIRTPSAYPQRP